MALATGFNATLTDWLANLAAGRRATLESCARRFASLISSAGEIEGVRVAEQAVDGPGAILGIGSGLHRGATVELTAREYLIGSGDDCDVVLRDGYVAAHHCRLTRKWSGFEVRDLRTDKPRVIAPKVLPYDGRAIEAQYEVGGVVFTLRQRLAVQRAERTEKAHPRFAPGVLLAALAAGIALVIWTLGAADRQGKWGAPRSVTERIATGNSQLAALGFDSVHFIKGANGELDITGVLSDSAHAERLDSWLKRANYGDVHIKVQLVPSLIEQARHALADDSLHIDARDGRLRVEGVTANAAEKVRIRALSDDLRGTIAVEDHVEYVDRRAASRGPFPLRLRGVMIGKPSYFLTDTGARYFVGGVLPDGAEVLSIDAAQIQFRLEGSVVAYKLE